MRAIIIFLAAASCLNFPAQAAERNIHFEAVFEALVVKNVLNSNYDRLVENLKSECHISSKPQKEQYSLGNIECEKSSDFTRLFIDGSDQDGVASITAVISGTDKCAYIGKKMREIFGRPTTVTAECKLDWVLRPAKNGGGRRLIGFEEEEKNNSIHLSISEESAP